MARARIWSGRRWASLIIPRNSLMNTPNPSLTASLMHLFPVGCFSAFVVAMAVAVAASHREQVKYNRFLKRTASVSVVPPSGVPPENQESIDAAVEMYSIQVPLWVKGPILDVTSEDRGHMYGGISQGRRLVTIGLPAFSSWGLLGSTIAHEAEIHANQSFIALAAKITMGKLSFGLRAKAAFVFPALKPTNLETMSLDDGYVAAEREAYSHELKSAKRFSLTPHEVRGIEYTLSTLSP